MFWPRAYCRSESNAVTMDTPVALREDTFRLFDDDPAVECALKMLGQHGAALGGTLLQDADGGDVRQCLR